MLKYSLAAALIACAAVAVAQERPKIDPALVDKYVAATWARAAPEWKARIEQDETQKICSATRNEPSQADFEKIREREKATVVFPADGNVLGKWQDGRRVAQTGTGGQFSDAADAYRGGNCYACHQLSPQELSYGTLGPSLTGYGRDRKYDPQEAKNLYAKIYNAQSVMPCSQMPRFGSHKFLSEQQLKDVTAYLFDPDSPVNKK